jgi:uncharacterized membrane protein YfcA
MFLFFCWPIHMPDLSSSQWLLAILAAAGIGVSKSGFTGLGMFHVAIFAMLFGAKESTGIVLPMLIVGDVCSVAAFGKSAHWRYIKRVFPPAAVGVVIGWTLMEHIDRTIYLPVIGGILLSLVAMQLVRLFRPYLFELVPHTWWFAWSLGILAGITTMMANAAGPIVAMYLLAVSLPKNELVGTGAWCFLILNIYKLPFSAEQGLIRQDTLTFNLALTPVIVAGTFFGRWLVQRVPQKLFDGLLLTFIAVAALRFVGFFSFIQSAFTPSSSVAP